MLLLVVIGCQRQTNTVKAEVVRDFADRPKNIVLLIGDGFALSQMSAMTYQNGNQSSLENFPVIGLHKATAFDNLITDSAAGATAFACGCKTYNAAIGVDSDTIPCHSILEQAEERGMSTGLIATSPITHATPAAFIAHEPLRTFNEEIAADFLNTDIDLFIGGGQRYFERRDDNRDLVKELKAKGYSVNSYFDTDLFHFRSIDKKAPFAFFTSDNQPVSAMQGRDYLPYAAHLSLPFLKERSDMGFFIMIEGSQIDWAGHAKDGPMMLGELQDFDATIWEVLKFAANDRETLVIVTGDHECGGVAIQPGSKFKKVELAFTTNGHTAALVPVYAYGPGAEIFRGIYDNTQLYFKMVEALGW
ncbi:MAG: alkaline phosphatase [Saprospirales bacterium]|nr:alkaline phosphatase [Saprospirales bacterium]